MSSKAYELLQQIKDLCVVDGTTEDLKILKMLNLTQWNIYNASPRWRTLEGYPSVTTTANISYVAAPSTLAMIYDVTQTSDQPYVKLEYVEPRNFHELIPQPTQYGTMTPRFYTWWGGRLWLFPIPDKTYTLDIYGYLKPVGMKLYSAVTAAHSGTTVTGTTTNFLDNANVDITMFYAYQADVRSDGTYPWSTISAVTSNTAMTISAYTGASGATTVPYACSSASTFAEDFDLLLIYGTSIMYGGRLREFDSKLMEWLVANYTKTLSSLVDAQTFFPDYTPILEDFSTGKGKMFRGEEYKYPFIVGTR